MNIPIITLMAAVASTFIQIGAQLFALVVVASTVSKAPPRSFAILQGEYAYNSSAFWSTVPMITFVLLVIALITNWKTGRRKYLILSLTLFILGGLVAGLFVQPIFDEMKAMGYRDEIDPVLQSRAATWYFLDWTVWGTGLVAGLALLIALIHPQRSGPVSTNHNT